MPTDRSRRSEKDPRAQRLFAQIDRDELPMHVAVVMDGSGRWARKRGYLDRTRGHEAAVNAVRDTVRVATKLHMRALTLFAFSSENWARPRAEVSFLMRLLERFLIRERDELMGNDIRVVHSGFRERLPRYALRALDKTVEMTAPNRGLVLNLAINYGGRSDIVEAARRFAREVVAGKQKIDDLDVDRFSSYLDHPELGDPDLMIRTSGEMRISNFLLWQLAYTEIYVTPTLWPDFCKVDFLEAVIDYQTRERRFGGIG